MFKYINGLASDHPFNTWDETLRFDELNAQNTRQGILAFQAQVQKWVQSVKEQGVALDLNTFLKSYDNLNKRLEEFDSVTATLSLADQDPDSQNDRKIAATLTGSIRTQCDLNSDLYNALLKIKASVEYTEGPASFKHFINSHINRHKFAGVLLCEGEKTKLASLDKKIIELESEYGEKLSRAQEAWFFIVKNKQALNVLPSEMLETLRENAKARNLDGYAFTMQDKNILSTFYASSTNRDLQILLRRAENTIATKACPVTHEYDTQPLIRDILKLRHEKARLLGYKTYAHYKAAQTALKTPEKIEAFLNAIGEKLQPQINKHRAHVKQTLRKHYQLPQEDYLFEMYHDGLYRHHIRSQQGFENAKHSHETYITEDAAYQTLFEYLKRTFGLQVQESVASHAWSDDVRRFEVFNEKNERLGEVFTDIRHRPGKLPGAQCAQARVPVTSQDKDIKPIGLIAADYMRDPKTNKALLSISDFSILMHEFGHFINLIASGNNPELSFSGQRSLAGVNMDGIEMPSQYLERRAFNIELLTQALTLSHPDNPPTANQIKEELYFISMTQAKNLMFQVKTMLYDLKLHWRDNEEVSEKLTREVHEALHQTFPTSAMFSFENPSNTFLHAFFHRYECMLYSYLWTLVQAINLYQKFENHAIDDPEIGRLMYEKIYAIGGGEDFYDRFKEVYGGEIDIDAFIAYLKINKPIDHSLKEFSDSLDKSAPPAANSTSAPILRTAPWQPANQWVIPRQGQPSGWPMLSGRSRF